MRPCCLCSSIAKKQLMGVTGLALCAFLIAHLAGNCLLFFGAEAFNTYAHVLVNSPLLYPAEAILLALFVCHVALAALTTLENRRARGKQSYYRKKLTGRGATFASSSMPYTGVVILIFLIFHLWHFKFGPHYTIVHSGVEMRDLYRLLVEYFHSPLAVVWYILAQICLGIHLSHGFWSAFQSLGFHHPRYTPWLKVIGKIYAGVISMGFSILPIYLAQQGAS